MKNEKIHILHLIDCLHMGGAEVLLIQIIKALGTEKYKHFVFYFANDGPVREKIESMGIPVHKGKNRASIKQPIRFITTIFDLLHDLTSYIKYNRIQIIQSHMGPANQLAIIVGKLTNTPTFPTVHTPLAFVNWRNRWDVRMYLKKAVNQIVYRIADRVVVVSREIEEIVQQCFGLKKNKIIFLKNGIMLDDIASESHDAENIYHEAEDRLKILAVGRLVSLKNFDVLIRAVKEVVNRDHNNILVLIAGEGEERYRLETLINELRVEKYVKLLGLKTNVMELMKNSDFFVISSSYEGLSIAMIEAMACGLPIISSDIRGLKDCITHYQNGLVFPVGDHKALADNILKLTKNAELRLKLSHGAKKSFATKYDMRKNIKSLDLIFSNI